MPINRRRFVSLVPAFGGFVSLRAAAQAQVYPPPPPADGTLGESFPSHDPAVVQTIVGLSHSNLPGVRELIERSPALAKAAWDWGYGDWETALGAAAHTGQREIARLLLAHGAPPTIFSAAMLGQLEVVRALVSATPSLASADGPHGIPLIAHARAGGADAAAVVTYLESSGAAAPAAVPLPDEQRAAFEGRYRFASGARDLFVVDVVRNGLGINRPGATRRGLVHLGAGVFHPIGAEQVRITFEHSSGRAGAVTIADGGRSVRATRELSLA